MMMEIDQEHKKRREALKVRQREAKDKMMCREDVEEKKVVEE
jgi:hypothetical protein